MQNYSISEDFSETLTYPDPSVPIRTWTAHAYDFPTMAYVNHWHSDFEFAYVLSGSVKHNINGKIIDVKSGNLLFINSRSMHFNFWSKPTDCEFIVLLMHPSLIANRATEKDNERLFGNTDLPYLLINCKDHANKKIADLFMRLHDIVNDGTGSGYELMGTIYGLFSEILGKMNETDTVSASERRQIEIMHRITSYIQENYQNKLTLKDISEAGLVCRSKCGDIFRKFLGKTPIEYLTEYRILKALELLRDTDLSITEISMRCGFGGASYFTEKFVELMSFTPSEYRKQQNSLREQ